MDKHYTKAFIEKGTSDDEFVAVASTAKEDRHGEIVSVEGWDLKNFKKNPVLLWAHDHHEPAVGVASKVWVDGKGKSAKLMIKGKFHEYTERAKAVKQMVKDGIIQTMSVGFQPKDMDGNTFTAQELLEVSFVNVPANPTAQISAIKSLRSAGIKDTTISELGIPVAVIDRLEKLENEVSDIKKSVVKAQTPAAPQGRYSRVIKERQSMVKVIATATDKLLEGDKKGLPREQRTRLTKVIKRATENISKSHKGEINGLHNR